MGRLADLDREVLGVLGVSSAVRWARDHPVSYLAGLFGVGTAPWLIALAVGWPPLIGLAIVGAVAYMAGVLVLVLAVTDDMNARGRAGGLWGVGVLLFGPLAGVLWLLVRDDHSRGEPAGE